MKLIILFSVFAILVGCTGPKPIPEGSLLLRVTENPDKSQDYHFRNGVTCHKSADYTKFVKTDGALAIKNIFEFRGDFESKWENAKIYGPKFEELEAIFFNICYDYGSERLSIDKYKEREEEYNKIRKRILGEGTAIPAITQAIPVTMVSKLSGTEFSLDLTVRNPTADVIQLNEVRLDFYGKHGAAIAAVTQVSNTYTVLIETDGKTIVKPTPNSPDKYPAYAWFPAGCMDDKKPADRFIVKSPLWQTIKPNDVDRFIVKVIFPKNDCLEKATFEQAQVEITFNESEKMSYKKINIKPITK